MIMNYEVYRNGETVGEALVERQGLYYQIVCRCRMRKDAVYRIVADTSKGSVDLGICVPKGEDLKVIKRIPVSRIGDQFSRFELVYNDSFGKARQLLTPEKPIPDIAQLRSSRLVKVKDGLELRTEQIDSLAH